MVFNYLKYFCFLALLALQSMASVPAQIVTEVPNAHCEPVHFYRPVRMFKDPSPYREVFEEAYSELLYTTLRGEVHVLMAWPDRKMPVIAYIARLGEPALHLSPTRSFSSSAVSDAMVRPIKICSPSDGYNDALGFVLVNEWEEGRRRPVGEGISARPPSTPGNPIYPVDEIRVEATTRPF